MSPFSVSRQCAAVFLLLLGSSFLAGCQPGTTLGGTAPASDTEPLRESELRAFCPPVTLLDGTAYFRTYERGGEGDPDRIVYQASIADATRTCNYGAGAVTVTVAVAGKVVPGPKGRAGTITMPIRVAAVRGEEVLYSELYQHSVTVADTSGATQFLFTDPGVTVPGAAGGGGAERGVRILVGYDEGPDGSR